MWDDPDFRRLTREQQVVWWYLLEGPEAQSSLPGLMLLTVETIAGALRMGTNDAYAALGALCEPGFIEIDPEYRLIRVCNAPHHRPPGNTNVVKGWYRRWKDLPKSHLRYRHLKVLGEAVCAISDKFRKAWEETFGKEEIPSDGGGGAPPNQSQGMLFGKEDNKGNQNYPLDSDTAGLKAFESLPEKATISVSVIRDPISVSASDSEKPSLAAQAEQLWEMQEDLRLDIDPNSLRNGPSPGGLKLIVEALGDYTFEQLEHVLRVTAATAEQEPERRRWFNGSHNWRPRHLEMTVGQAMPVSTGYHRTTGNTKFQKGNVFDND